MDKLLKLFAEEQQKYPEQGRGSMVFDGKPNSSHVLDAAGRVPSVSSYVPGATLESQPEAKLFLQTLVNLRDRIDKLIGGGWPLKKDDDKAAEEMKKKLDAERQKNGSPPRRASGKRKAADEASDQNPEPAPATAAAVTPSGTEGGRPANNLDSSSPKKRVKGVKLIP